jgi:hypothetical protein
MAELTTLDGLQLFFDPSAIAAVADHDADTQQAVTTVYGLTAGRLRISESVPDFLNRIAVTSAFARLTRLDGTFIWVNCAALKVIRSPLPGEYADAARTVFSIGTLIQAVKDSLADARVAVNSPGGNL